jgi:hypothetical protein
MKWYSGIIIAGCIAACIFIAGCTGNSSLFNKSSVQLQPETGIDNWIAALNSKDIPRLYTLSPSVIRSNISEQDFIRANEDNILLKPGVGFTDLEIINKTSDMSKATIKASVIVDQPGTGRTPVFYTFQLFFEDGEWKVWTNDI